MAIYKVIPGDSQEKLIQSVGQMHQVYESGRHIKSAASPLYSRADLQEFAPPPGYFLSHMITMGSAEQYGGNRNHDLWPHEELKKSHHTFVTHGRNYREHRNKRVEDAIGLIKSARYDENLQRGEVLMWTEIEKAAGEFEKARNGEEQSGSMAASVDHDVCERCDFISKFASERCDCIRTRPGSWDDRLKKFARMINFGPLFKDYSYVGRPADRIAHYLNYLMPQEKLASTANGLTGEQLAAAYGMFDTSWLEPLRKIAAFDKPQTHPAKQAAQAHQFSRAFHGEFDPVLLEKMASHPFPARVLRSLIKRAMVMPLASFNSFVTGQSLAISQASQVVKEASSMLPFMREQLVNGDPQNVFSQAVEQFEPSGCGCDDLIDTFLDRARDQFSLRYEALAKRALHNPVSLEKQASVITNNGEARALSMLYNAYLSKVATELGSDDWTIEGQLAALR